MNFKDLLRVLRRRWLTATVVFAAVFAGVMAYSAVTESVQYRARARIIINTPPFFISSTPGAQWINVSPMEPKTWLSIIATRQIRVEAEAKLRQRASYPVRSEWFATVTAVPEPASQLVWIEATAPTPQIASDVANAVAEATETYSDEVATDDLRKAIAKARERRGEEKNIQTAEEARSQKLREDARVQLGADSLELDVRKLEEEVVAHETRRRDLERKAATNRLRLERIGADRSVTEHLQREGAPRLGSASSESRVAENRTVRTLTERLETIHKDLLTSLRKYTEEHPQVKTLRSEMRLTELELTRAQLNAVGRDIDREDLERRTENELIAIELRVLAPELKQLRERLKVLAPALEQAKIHDRSNQDARGRVATLETILAQLENNPRAGYVRLLEKDKAQPEDARRIDMKLRRSWPVALLASIIVGISFAFLLEFVDTSIRNDYDVRRHLDYPVLAVVPRVRPEEVLTVRAARASVMSEIYDTLATVLLSTPTDRPSRVFMVTSTNPQEGKTVVSINLAVALARQGKRTLLIDGDMRVPTIHSALVLANTVGLSEVLSGQVQASAEGVMQEVDVPNLKVLTSGSPPQNPYELLDPGRLAPIAAQLREQFEAIVIDTPPVLRTGDALKFSTLADTCLFVVEAGRTDQRQATWAKRLLQNVGARVAGVVLNRSQAESEEYYYYYGSGGAARKETRTA